MSKNEPTKLQDAARPLGAKGDHNDGQHGNEPLPCNTTILPCPFCGRPPVVDQGKLMHCQLHGEPYQSIIIRCKTSDCPARPQVQGGDIHNEGWEQAKKKALEKWNTRRLCTTTHWLPKKY